MLLEPVAGATVTFDPLVEEWFASKFGVPTAPQIAGWPQIQSGKDVLISAPTGSGKTLAAFLVAVDRLLRDARRVLSDSTLRLSGKRLGLKRLPVDLLVGPLMTGIVTLKNRTLSPTVQAFIACARDVARPFVKAP